MARIAHFEHMYEDPEAAAAFYREVFGWKVEKWQGGEEPYWLITTGADDEQPGINGGFMHNRNAASQTVMNTVTVTDLDDATKKIEATGGRVVVAKMAIPGVGYQAYFADPGGVVFGVHQTDMSAK